MTRREVTALGLLFLLSLPAVTTRLYASDEVQFFAWLRSIAFDRDVHFENEYRHFYDAGVARSPEFHETFLERTNEVGRPVNYGAPGSALLWAPFYAVGHLTALMTGAPTDGFSPPYIAAVAYGSAFYGFLAVLLSASAARRVTGHGVTAAIAVALGTPLLFYTYIAPGFAHATSAFAVSLFVWIWVRVRERWTPRGAVALGLAGGLMPLVREQDVLLVAGPALDFLMHAWRTRRPEGGERPALPWRTAVAGALAFALAWAPLFLAYLALNGHAGPTETAARKMTWWSPHAFAVLFSPEHGFFAWTPIAVLAIWGLIAGSSGSAGFAGSSGSATGSSGSELVGPNPRNPRNLRNLRNLWFPSLVMVAAQVYSSGSVESWTVAGAFGQRRFVALTPLLVLGLAALFAHVRASVPRRFLVAAVALCVWWNLGLMAQFGMNRMDRQRLTLLENARVTFLELPTEAPRIVWRYLTDRESFYRR